jgi:hypothetical protein
VSIDNFIPEVWSARLIRNLERAHVYGQEGVVTREYEGEIRDAGDTVRIMSIGPVTINNYTKNSDIAAPQELQDAQAILQVTQSKYFNFQVDDVDQAQIRVDVMDEAMRRAAYGLSNVADSFIASQYVDIPSTSSLGTDASPITPTATTAYELLVDLSVKLTENDVPMEGRWIVVPAWFTGLMAKDNRFVSGATPMSESNIRNGIAGTVAGFTLIQSNNVPTVGGTKYKLVAGVPGGIAYVEQIRKTEAYRPERRFADAVKGLHLYGAKVVRPELLAVATVLRT